MILLSISSLFSTDRRYRQYRNMIKLRYKRGGFVYLIERHLQLEIYFSFYEQLLRECATIRNLVLESIRLTEKSSTLFKKEKVPSPRWILSYAAVARAVPTTLCLQPSLKDSGM